MDQGLTSCSPTSMWPRSILCPAMGPKHTSWACQNGYFSMSTRCLRTTVSALCLKYPQKCSFRWHPSISSTTCPPVRAKTYCSTSWTTTALAAKTSSPRHRPSQVQRRQTAQSHSPMTDVWYSDTVSPAVLRDGWRAVAKTNYSACLHFCPGVKEVVNVLWRRTQGRLRNIYPEKKYTAISEWFKS